MPVDWCKEHSDDRFESEGKVLRDFTEVLKSCQKLTHLEVFRLKEWLTMDHAMSYTFTSLRSLEYVAVGVMGELGGQPMLL